MIIYENIYRKIERQRTETANQKDNFKRALLELFKKGLTPEQITLEMLGKILNMPEETKEFGKKINSKIHKIFGFGKETVIPFLFKEYQEKNLKI